MERKFPSAGLDFAKALVFKLWPISQSLEGLAKIQIARYHLQSCSFHRFGWPLKICIYDKFLGDADASSSGNWEITFWEPLHLTKYSTAKSDG